MKILIIEDEQPAARRLKRLISEIDKTADVVHTIDSVEDAISYLKTEATLDLIFMDIQLADGLSFDIFDRINVTTPVIFTTAYDQFALKAFKVNSVDYLLKPIEEADLINALNKFKQRFNSGEKNADYSSLIDAIKSGRENFKKRFLIKTAGRLAFVHTDDVAYFFSDDGNTFLVTAKGDRFLIESVLDVIENQLNPSAFFRINRKMIVALSCITKIESYLNNRFVLTLNPSFEEETIVSRQRSADFKSWLDQ